MAADGARRFLFVLHCHQPAGNLPEVMAEAYSRCYRPLLSSIEQFEAVKVCLHVSGALLEHMALEEPEVLAQLGRLAARKQVELVGGGFYEPVLHLLPEADAQGQLEMMSRCLSKHFGARPRGAWLTERVWDPELPRLLAPAGLRYTFVDAPALQASLPDGGAADGYWVTQRAGHTLALFGIDRGLRYRIPGRDPEQLVAELPEMPGEDVITFADDGEKLGLWPGSYEGVHEQGWLTRFFEALGAAQAEGKVQTCLPTEVIQGTPPRGRVHLPSASYEELSSWALGPCGRSRLSRLEAAVGEDPVDRAHLRGGTWPDFLAHRAEAARLYGRMIAVSQRLEATLEEVAVAHPAGHPSALSDRLGTAQRALYRAQGADPYWQGLFAGITIPFLRADAYRGLLTAERILDEVAHGDEAWVEFEEKDLDLDGELEVWLANRSLAACVRPHGGGTLLSLDHRPRARALLDVLVAADATETRWGFVDHFLAADPSEAAKADPAAHDRGTLARARMRVQALDVDEADPMAAYVALEGTCEVASTPLTVGKVYRLDLEGAHMSLEYALTGRGEAPVSFTFAPQLSLSLGEQARLRFGGDSGWCPLDGDHEVAGELCIEDTQAGLRVTLDASWPSQLRARPVITEVRTPVGAERIFQGWSLDFFFPLELTPEETARLSLGLDVSEASP